MKVIEKEFIRKAPVFGLAILNNVSGSKRSSTLAWLDFGIISLSLLAVIIYTLLITIKDAEILQFFHPAMVLHITGLLMQSVCTICLYTVFSKRDIIQKLLSNVEIESY